MTLMNHIWQTKQRGPVNIIQSSMFMLTLPKESLPRIMFVLTFIRRWLPRAFVSSHIMFRMIHIMDMVLCISITLPEKIVAQIDSARGDVNRSKYISKLLFKAMDTMTTAEPSSNDLNGLSSEET